MEGVLKLQRQTAAAAAAAAVGGEPGSAVETQRWANQDNERGGTGEGDIADKGNGRQGRDVQSIKAKSTERQRGAKRVISPIVRVINSH